ncbi:MAG: radical SAM family heme chaperone HemW [Haliangiales bacterium]
MPPVGVYIHVPWCRKLCPYCDFAVTVVGRAPIPHQAYLDALLAELDDHAAALAGRQLVSIYFGGGTPSLWQPACLAAAIEAVASRAGADPSGLEITIEANPDDCTAEALAAWRAAGIGRLSIGVQSLRPELLSALGRDHLGAGETALEAARAAGFTRVSADLIFGVPTGDGWPDAAGLDPAGLDPSVRALAETGVGHLSVYELTIEPRTQFGKRARRGSLVPLAGEVLADQYHAIDAALGTLGYEHYEISSYARPGQRAIHNQLYWTGAEYLGLGCGAASFVRTEDGGGERRTNVRSVRAYLAARGGERVAEREQLSAAEVAVDRVWLGLRTRAGIPAHWLSGAPTLLAWLRAGALVEECGDRLCPTLRGFSYADEIASRVFAAGATLDHAAVLAPAGARP